MDTQVARVVKFISIRVDPDFHARFKAAARAQHRNMEGELKRLMAQRIEEFEGEAA